MMGCNRVYVIYGGSGWYYDENREKPFIRGKVYLLPMQAEFRVRQLESDPLDHMFFDFSLMPPLNSAYVSSLELSRCGGMADPIRQTVEALNQLIALRGPAAQQAVPALFTGLLRMLCLEMKQSLSNDPRIETALERIHRIAPDGSLDMPDNAELAGLLHVDINHFIRIFRREVGVTPHQYMLSHRLNMASSYIDRGLSVADAARLVGYGSSSALSHAMKQRKENLNAWKNVE